MMLVNYVYTATVLSVYDGDTMRVAVDMGFGIQNRGDGRGLVLRLFRINTPEVRGAQKEKGKKSRDFVREKVLGKKITIKTIQDRTGKYGRYLADIYYMNGNNEQIHLNNELVSKNLAEWKNY